MLNKGQKGVNIDHPEPEGTDKGTLNIQSKEKKIGSCTIYEEGSLSPESNQQHAGLKINLLNGSEAPCKSTEK